MTNTPNIGPLDPPISKLLDECKTLATGDRAKTHGDFAEGMEASGIIHQQLENLQGWRELRPGQMAALRMVVVKLVRMCNGAHNRDDYLDAINYLAQAAVDSNA